MRRKLGQHFLLDPVILRRIVDASGLTPDDLVVEIGPGKGRLTEILTEIAREVIAIELDEHLCEILKESELKRKTNFYLECTDVLKFNFAKLPPFKVVANIPYYITTPIIFKLLERDVKLLTATLTIQKEVAERIISSPGGKSYGVLSLMVQYYTEPSILFYIPRGAFVPPPKVDSAVLHLKRRRSPPVTVEDEGLFFRIIKKAFSQRRKTIANSLKSVSEDIKTALDRAGIDYRRRPETLSMEEFARLSRSVRDLSV